MKDAEEDAKPDIVRVKELATTNEALRVFFDHTEEKVKRLKEENKKLLLSLDDEAKERDKEQQLNVNAGVVKEESKPKGNVKAVLSVLQEKCPAPQTETKLPTKKMSKGPDTGCSSKSEIQDHVIEKLKKELEECQSSLSQLKSQNEELSSKLQAMRSEFSEPQSGQQTKDSKEGLQTKDNKEGYGVHLLEELEMEKCSLAKVKNDLDKEREEKRTLQEELKKCKELLDEYSECQLSLMEQAAELNDELQEVHGELDRVDSELTDKTYEGSELELELHIWKTTAERLKQQYEESQAMRRKLEASLLAQSQVVEMINRDKQENDLKISNIEQQIVLLDQGNMVVEENPRDEIEKVSKRSQIGDDDQEEQELLAGELEEAILAHIMKEKNYTQLPIVLELMRSELSEIGSNEQLEEIEAQLMGQTERGSLAKTKSELEREHREKLTLQEELNKYREMLDESTECQLTIIEQACDTERKLIDELQEVQGVLERVDSELTDTTHERTELELELELWKSTAERLQMQLEESQGTRKQLEASLMAQARVGEQNTINEFKNTTTNLQTVEGDQQEQELLARELEQAILAHIMKERNYTQQSLMLKLMRSEFPEAGLDAQSKEKASSFAHLMKQLEMKNDYLAKVQAKLEKECKEKLTLKKELDKYKEMLDESSKSQLNIMQQAVEIETQLTDELLEVRGVLHRVDSELTDKTNEGTELEFELQVWKSIAERLNVQVEESQGIRKKLEASLLAVQTEVDKIPKQEINKNDQSISNTKQQMDDDDGKEQELLARELEQAIVTHIMRERNCT